MLFTNGFQLNYILLSWKEKFDLGPNPVLMKAQIVGQQAMTTGGLTPKQPLRTKRPFSRKFITLRKQTKIHFLIKLWLQLAKQIH